ncbi:MAG: phosphate ABC transporter permease subunit PstC [Nitrospirae bacterium]|nr:phosphate ABC transporter permease subunit PstC [Nitrospirota bacterium]
MFNKRVVEKLIEVILLLAALLSVFTTVGIVLVLLFQTYEFFAVVRIRDFLFDTQWTPLFAEKHFGIISLFCGTFLTTFISMLIALPIGLIGAIYISEYSNEKTRKILKPSIEILAAVPTVVYGYFALLVITPFLQKIIPNLSGFNAISPGIVMGIMIIPIVLSMSEDSLRSVPISIRESSFALGASKFQTSFKIVLPAALSGVAASFILGISRAIGETMVVAIAAGQQSRFTLNPLIPIETVTAYIVQVSLGDTPTGTLEFKTIFAAGMSLFVVTFFLNILSYYLKKKFRYVYE